MERASVASSAAMPHKPHSLFQVYLRLRPAQGGTASTSTEPFIALEEPHQGHTAPTHITLNPPNDRRRAIEKFAFTQVFEEDATQLDVFHCTNVISLVEGVLAPHGGEGTDALLATLGVTGSGKVRGDRMTTRSSTRMLTTDCLADAHHSRLTVAARNDTTGARCHIPVSGARHPRLRHAARARRLHRRLRRIRVRHLCRLVLPRDRVWGVFRTVEAGLEGTYSHACTTPSCCSLDVCGAFDGVGRGGSRRSSHGPRAAQQTGQCADCPARGLRGRVLPTTWTRGRRLPP